MELIQWVVEFFHWFIDIVLHLDVHLVELLRDYGFWVYLILFAIVFAETGFVITPFLPGDALLFDHLFLHRTGAPPGIRKPRYAIESWFFAPSAYPAQQVPLML